MVTVAESGESRISYLLNQSCGKPSLTTTGREALLRRPPTEDQDFEGTEEKQDPYRGKILKYVAGVDLSFSKNDPSIACAALVVLDFSTLEVVYEVSAIVKLHSPYILGFLAFREICYRYSFGCPVDVGASWLHGVCNENPLSPVIRRLGLTLYRTSGDDSILYDHDLESLGWHP